MSASWNCTAWNVDDRPAELLAAPARTRRRGRRRPARGRRPSRRPRCGRRRGSRGTGGSPGRAARAGCPPARRSPGTRARACRRRASRASPSAPRSRSRACRSGRSRFEISSSPVRAVIVTQAVMSVPALVMKIFEPLTTHSPSRSSARRARRARVGAGARLGQPERRELASRRRGRAATPASAPRVPKRKIGIVPSEVCAATVIATDESIRVSSSIAIAYESVSPPRAAVLLRDRAFPSARARPARRRARTGSGARGRAPRRRARPARSRELAHGVADRARARARGRSSRRESRGELDDQADAVARTAVLA